MTARRLLALLAIVIIAVLLGGCSKSRAPSAETASPSAETASPDGAQTGTAQPPSENPGGGSGVRYLSMGDSLTQGVGATDEQTGAFPALLSEKWRADGCEVELLNVGVSGYTAGQVLSDQVPNIQSFQPTVITFQAGGNDIANGVTIDEYRGNVQQVLDAATASGALVFVLAQNEWFRSPEGQNYGTDLAAQRESYDAVMIEEAKSRGVEFVDLRPLYKQQADENQWVEDGIHPTPEAYQAWATELAKIVAAPCK